MKYLFYFQQTNLRIFIFILTISFLGLIGNLFFEYPWNRLSYEVAGVTIEGSRTGSYAGAVMRTGGFTGQHWTIASILSFTALYTMVYHEKKQSRKYAFIISITGIMLTFTKGLIASHLICSIIIFLSHRSSGNRSIRNIYFLVFCISIILPFFSFIFKGTVRLEDVKSLMDIIFLSFKMRVLNNWPIDINSIISQPVNWLFGRGLGSLGGAAVQYEGYGSTDNILLFFWGVGGLFGLFLLLYTQAKGFSVLKYELTKERLFILVLIVTVIVYGMLVNFIEFGVMGIVFGLVFGYSLNRYKLYFFVE